MSAAPPSRLFLAQWCWTGERWLGPAVAVWARGGVIEFAGPAALAPADSARGRSRDLGGAILVPGFVNAHAHVEYSFLRGRLEAGQEFSAWLVELVRRRRRALPLFIRRHARRAAREIAASGATAILDIATAGAAAPALRACGLRARCFLEAIELNEEKATDALAALERRLESAARKKGLAWGLSPHAPYTLSPQIAEGIGRLARRRGLPLAIHLAESPAELDMLARGEGPLVEAFRRFGVLPAKWRAPGLTPVEWADRAALLGPATLAVHCNYLADSDIAILAKRKTSVVYCPKSHAFFGHPRHPLPRLMDAGVNVCLGTDSLASNDGLDLLEEMAQARDACLSVVPSALFAAASGAAGRFVGAPAPLGRIEPGFAADMTALWPRERWQAPPANSAIGMEKAESALSRLLEKNAIERRLGIAGGVMIA